MPPTVSDRSLCTQTAVRLYNLPVFTVLGQHFRSYEPVTSDSCKMTIRK